MKLSRINKFLPNILWRMPDENVYLSFDDGPDKDITPKLLDVLQRYDVKATFFLVGQKAERHPDIVLQIKNNGHTIGNHSFSHPRMLWKSKDLLKFELNRTDEILYKITGENPTLFRPPYGLFGIQLLNLVKITNHKIVLWNASVYDYKSHATAQKIKIRWQKIICPGQIILLHDGHSNSLNTLVALEKSLGDLKDRVIKFSAIPEN